MDKRLIKAMASKMLDILIEQDRNIQYKKLDESKLIAALKECNYNKVHAAKKLGVSRSTLYRNMERFGL